MARISLQKASSEMFDRALNKPCQMCHAVYRMGNFMRTIKKENFYE